MRQRSLRQAAQSMREPPGTAGIADIGLAEADANSHTAPPSAVWLTELLQPRAVRRHIGAGDRLFSMGDPASHYFLVETGSLVLQRGPRRSSGTLRFVHKGDLFIFDCGGLHAANCTALGSIRLLSIERRRIEIAAMLDPMLRGVLQAAHARELGFILESLGVEHPVRKAAEHASSAVGTEQPGHAFLEGRWLPNWARNVRSA